jgi:NTP pyrophosphatase (non-canonical NTP hydrolase)
MDARRERQPGAGRCLGNIVERSLKATISLRTLGERYMSDIQELQRKIVEFRDARNWAQFHNPKDIALCLSIEASELLELFLWKRPEEAAPERVREELADVLYSVLLLAKHYEIDLPEALNEKLVKNAEKYPVDQSWGSNKKYSER